MDCLKISLLMMGTILVYVSAKPQENQYSTNTTRNTTCPNCLCQPSLTDGTPGANICLYDKEFTLIRPGVDVVNFIGGVIRSAAFLTGNCVCNQGCSLSQLTCQDPGALTMALNIAYPDHSFNFYNGGVIFAYEAAEYYVYCYCTTCFQNQGPNGGCAERPNINPGPCNYPPVGTPQCTPA